METTEFCLTAKNSTKSWDNILPALVWADNHEQIICSTYLFSAPVKPVAHTRLAKVVFDYICAAMPEPYVVSEAIFAFQQTHGEQGASQVVTDDGHLYGLVCANKPIPEYELENIQQSIQHRCVDWSSCSSSVTAFAHGNIIFAPLERHFASAREALCAIDAQKWPISDGSRQPEIQWLRRPRRILRQIAPPVRHGRCGR